MYINEYIPASAFLGGVYQSWLYCMMDVTALYRIKLAAASSGIILLVDLYAWRALRVLLRERKPWLRWTVYGAHWLVTVGMITAALWYCLADPLNFHSVRREWILGIAGVIYVSKFAAITFIVIDDVRRIGLGIAMMVTPRSDRVEHARENNISRSEFLAKAAVVAGAVPFTTLSFGILSGAHDYHVVRRSIVLPNLPRALDGLRIGQLSDIHAGTLFNKTAIQGGVDMLLQERPDVIFFTGDLINYYAREIRQYVPLFSSLRAPLGVFSITGNHDHGDYNWWPSLEAKQADFELLKEAHKAMGFDLLLNENRTLTIDGEPLAIVGIQNWSARGKHNYGRMDLAVQHTDDAALRLLLSHDPSHWDAEVRKLYRSMDVTFAGHTHGFQFGVEAGGIRWSPAQYVFKQWAGLYHEEGQYLYVNRGFGCIGYPGRVGIPPELSILELHRA